MFTDHVITVKNISDKANYNTDKMFLSKQAFASYICHDTR